MSKAKERFYQSWISDLEDTGYAESIKSSLDDLEQELKAETLKEVIEVIDRIKNQDNPSDPWQIYGTLKHEIKKLNESDN